MRVSCTVCGVTVVVSSLKGHMLRQYGRSKPQTREMEIGGGGGDYLCGFLSPGAEDCEMPGAGLSVSSA